MLNRFPFDHLTLKEVAEADGLLDFERKNGRIPCGKKTRWDYLAAKRRPPLYDPPPPRRA